MEGSGYEEDGQEKHFQRQLAALVRNIQWSYAIFWSISTTQQGVLVWRDGYYNGDIKTLKTTQPTEFKADQMGLQRSEQLRDLYLSLSAGDSNQQSKRPASLSPEDLTDSEWYYLVCMSFTFVPDRGLPGKAFASNEYIWLSNAQFADGKIFTRSLLAKSASIQTVVCIPFMNGVLEFGTTELVLEDPALVNHLTTSFWELAIPICTEQSISSPRFPERDQKNHINDTVISPNILLTSNETEEFHANFYEDIKMDSPDTSRKDSPHMTSSFDFNTEIIDDDFHNGLNGSLNPGNCMSPKNVLDVLTEETERDLVSLDLDGDASHYAKTLAAVLRNSKNLNSFVSNSIGGTKSSFAVWAKDLVTEKVPVSSQNLVKKVLSGRIWMNSYEIAKGVENGDELQNKVVKIGFGVNASHVMSDKNRKEKLSEKFVVLRSLVPSISKVDKTSILNDTIEYVKELEHRVEELESGESKPRRKNHPDISERTSDNYHAKIVLNGKKLSINKRKVRDVDESDTEQHLIFSKDINVTMCEREAVIVMHCQWRNFLLLEIFEAIGNLHLDPVSVQSSISDGDMTITIKAKFVNSVIASPGMIKQTLQRVVGKC
ncbi:hypothetical protein LUZ60_016779 [Juncus effusus]|nr:hypothetical protein LUZ60_016779 [Juncus effusus]